MPRPPGSPKTGGRTAGTPNRATREVKEFLGKVFARAFTETVAVSRRNPTTGKAELVPRSLEDALVEQIVTLTIDAPLLALLLAHYAGRPTQAVDHTHSGKVALERIIAGTALDDEGIDT